jgi:enamine deaminase RidA (YjgF/YER057c/UK114 family)
MLKTAGGEGDLTFISWVPDGPDSSLGDVYEQIGRILEERQSVLLADRVYGELQSASQALEARRGAMDRIDRGGVAPTYVDGSPCEGTGLAGLHAIAVQPATPEDVRLIEARGHVLGRLVRGRDAEYLALSDVGRPTSARPSASPQEETAHVLETARQVLEGTGWTYRDVRRTWFYLRDILDWYREFNGVRNEFFEAVGLRSADDSVIPASTGIEGRNVRGNWCTLDLLAMRPLEGRTFGVRRLTHSKQSEAPEYGSAFPRGLEVALESCRLVFVSGTASIGCDGASLHRGDFGRQMEQTLESVAAVLAAAGAGLGHLCQSTLFIKRVEDAARLEGAGWPAGLSDVPTVRTRANVCREELLFELDGTAVVERTDATR